MLKVGLKSVDVIPDNFGVLAHCVFGTGEKNKF